MAEKAPQDNTPFVPSLEPDIFNDPHRNRAERLQGIQGRNDLVVRVDPVYPKSELSVNRLADTRAEYQQDQNTTTKRTAYQSELDHVYDISEITQYRTFLKQLEQSNIKHSGFSPVIASDKTTDEVKLYIITDKINGLPIEDNIRRIPEDAMINTFINIIDYYKHLITQGGLYNLDMGLDQFMYSPDNHELVLVDHVPSDIEPVKAGIMELEQQWKVRLYRDLAWLEKSYNKQYPEIRQAIDEIAAPKRS